MRKWLLVALIFSLVATLSLASLSLSRANRVQEEPGLPTLGTVGEFTFIDSTAMPFDQSRLAGKIWVADFIFTSCPGICPVMSTNMSDLAKRFADREQVEFVSVSVDPKTDSPDILTQYAARYDADVTQWHFLTGTEASIQDLAREQFKLGSGDSPLIHSPRFVLIDAVGAIRGYYIGTETEGVEALARDIDRLLEESAS